MKKRFVIIIILLFILIIPRVNAGKDDTNLYCEYSDTRGGSPSYYMLIEFTSTNINSFDYSFRTIPDDNTIILAFELNNKNDLLNNDVLSADGHLTCPNLAIKTSGKDKDKIVLSKNASSQDKFLYVVNTSCPKDDCNFFNDSGNQIIEKPAFNCFYLSQNSDKEIAISREQEGGKVYITYPDGTKEETSYPITETCQDFYFNTKSKKIKIATYEYLGNISQLKTYDPAMYEFICGSSSENNKNVEYFCEEGCNFKNNANIKCEEVSDTINKGNINLEEMCNLNGVKNTLKFLGYILLIVKILVPVLLIVLGVVDYTKAIASSDSESVQKATKLLATRIIAGVAIFLIPTIVNFVFKGLLNGSDSQFNDCRECIFEPSKCD